MPKVPADQFDRLEVAIQMPAVSDLAKNIVQVPYSQIAAMSTVVISHGGLGSGAVQQGKALPVNGGMALASAKEEMQKELIRRGFRVLDQVQVNGRLRELATTAKCEDSQLWWRCTTGLSRDEVGYLNGLKVRLDRREVQSQQFSGEVEKYRRAWDSRVTGPNALRDAIKAGKVAVDYVLEIEAFEPAKIVNSTLNLSTVPKVRGFIRDYPDLRPELAKKRMMNCAGIGSEIKARLVSTKTSEVLWMGGHVVSEITQSDSEYLIELGVRKSVANKDEVYQYVANQAKSRKKKSAEEMPAWRFRTELVGPTLVQGSCNLKNQSSEDVQRASNELAGQVARELASTIKLGGQSVQSVPGSSAAPAAAPPSAPPVPVNNKPFLRDAAGPIRVR